MLQSNDPPLGDDTVIAWSPGETDADSGWTICIQTLDETMVQPAVAADALQVGGAGPNENPSFLLSNTVSQAGLAASFTTGELYSVYQSNPDISHENVDTNVWFQGHTGQVTIRYDFGSVQRFSSLLWWPNDGVFVPEIALDFSLDCVNYPDPIWVIPPNFSFNPTNVAAGGTINPERIEFPVLLGENLGKGQCVQLTFVGGCFSDALFTAGSETPCSFSELAFLQPDSTADPVEFPPGP